MPHLSVATAIEKNKVASEVAFIAMLEITVIDPTNGSIVETLRIAKNSEDITFEGHTWAKGAFEFHITKTAGEVSDMTVTAKDYTRDIQARMQKYGGGTGFPVRVLCVNSANLSQGAEVEEFFEVVKASTKGFDVSFTLGAENPLTMRFPRRMQARDRCPWRYKGAECGYAGSLPTCDYTLQGDNGCAAHSNTLRFGGFPGISPLNSK